MPTKNPRVNVVLEERLYKSLQDLARRDGLSLSLKARDLMKEAIEIEEDVALARFAKAREKSFRRKQSLTHDEAWKR